MDYGPIYIKPIEGYEYYYVTVLGEILSSNPRGINNVIKPLFRLISPSINRGGYLRVSLVPSKSVKKNLWVHQIVAKAFLPNPEKKPYVNHKDFNTAHNDVSNLEWVTPLENARHAKQGGHQPHGEWCGKSKLNESEVLQIRKERKEGLTYYALAEKFGMDHTTIAQIVKRKTWRHL